MSVKRRAGLRERSGASPTRTGETARATAEICKSPTQAHTNPARETAPVAGAMTPPHTKQPAKSPACTFTRRGKLFPDVRGAPAPRSTGLQSAGRRDA